MNSKSLSYLVLSDIHLGHRRNKTEFIIHNLREYFKDYNVELNYVQVRKQSDEQLNNNYRFNEKSLSY